MTDLAPSRLTIDQVDQSLPLDQWKRNLADYGRRRHLSYTLDFDTRLHTLEEPGEGWDEAAKAMHLANREQTRQRLGAEFGTDQLDAKIQNFVAIGSKPFSVLAYHNRLFDEVRRAFVIGAYYPALVGACALGERILNHLILDLRAHYSHTPEYKKVYRKNSFDDWRVVIDALEAWGVLLPKAVSEFRALMVLRHRSIHFNVSTYATLREDALAAILHMREIIDQQFTAFGLRPWFILGTKGHIFIKREWEESPFIKACYLPTCPFVGPYFAISFSRGLRFHDHNDYGDGTWTDEEFAQAFNDRTFEQMAPTD
jgi:hypothetical protein